ncbi:TIR domain-containing protein [bacterium]|nr:TIR domain-containing protein [bacterium]
MHAPILVVEDEAKWYEQYKDILGRDSNIDIAKNFQEATALLEKSNYHLVLLDICLNQADFNMMCQEFITFVRRQYPHLPLIAITGRQLELGEFNLVFQLGEGGIVDFMHKTYINTSNFRERVQHAEKMYPLKKRISSGSFQYDVFISYSHLDRDWVQEWLLSKLRSASVSVCIDFLDFTPGAPIVIEMEHAIMKSRKTLLILSTNYLKSAWTEYEYTMAQTVRSVPSERRLIPLLLSPCDLPLSLSNLVHLDFTNASMANLQIDRLITFIKS